MKDAQLQQLSPKPVKIIRERDKIHLANIIERSINKEKRKLADISLEIELKRRQMFDENRKRINSRLQNLQSNRAERAKRQLIANKELRAVRSRQEQKLAQQSRLEMQRLQEQAKQREKVILERKKLMGPLDFHQIGGTHGRAGASARKATYRSTSLTNHQNEVEGIPKNHSRVSDYIRNEFRQRKEHQNNLKTSAKLLLQRRWEYGEQAERTHRRSRLHTQPDKYELLEQRKRQATELWYYSEAKKKRKADLPDIVHCDPASGVIREIRGILASNRHFIEKYKDLGDLSRSYLSKYEQGITYGLQVAAEASLALADLYLKHF